jgi:Tetratricopeptide repeat
MAENPRVEELRRRVQADPASIAFAALAEEFRRVGRYEDAIETCRVGLLRHPAYLSARVTLGRALIEVGEYDAAREELETVLRSAPENIAATRGLAQIHERLGHSTEMHPDLAAFAEQTPIRVAPAPAPDPVPEPQPLQAAPAFSLSTFDLPLTATPAAEPEPEGKASEPFDIFAAALKRASAPAPAPVSAEPEPVEAEVEPPAVAFEPATIAFESATIAFEAPVMPPSAPAVPDAAQPDPHVAATLVRLEQLLGAIQSARHA